MKKYMICANNKPGQIAISEEFESYDECLEFSKMFANWEIRELKNNSWDIIAHS